jgi:hypothetical protein
MARILRRCVTSQRRSSPLTGFWETCPAQSSKTGYAWTGQSPVVLDEDELDESSESGYLSDAEVKRYATQPINS